MKVFKSIWTKLTQTKAIETSSGEYETMYFASVYRLTYLAGLSHCEDSLIYLVYGTTVKLSLLLLCLSEFWEFLSTEWTIDTVIDSVNITIIQMSAVYKYKKILSNKHIFKRLAAAMNSPNFDVSTEERLKLLDIWRKRNAANLKILLTLGTCAIIAWYIYPLVDDLDYNLMVSIRLPYEYQNPRIYTITYICVLIVFSYIAYFVMANDLTIQAHLMHILCQFAVLSNCFRNVLMECRAEFKGSPENQLYSNKEFQQKFTKRLGRLVQQHKYVLENTAELRDILSTPMLAQLAVSTTLICSIGYQLVLTSVNVNITKWLMTLFFLGYNMFVLYILCRWCEEIKIQSEAVGESVYMSGWERGVTVVRGVRSSVLLVLARCNKPLVLSAGGMYHLSLEAYASIIKTSYSALTVLLRFRQN